MAWKLDFLHSARLSWWTPKACFETSNCQSSYGSVSRKRIRNPVLPPHNAVLRLPSSRCEPGPSLPRGDAIAYARWRSLNAKFDRWPPAVDFTAAIHTSAPDRAEIGAATIEPSSFFTADVPSLTLRVQRGTSGAVHLPTNNTLPKEERILASRCPLRSRLDERHSGAEAIGAAWYLREAEVLRALAMGQKTF